MIDEAYSQAIKILKECVSDMGFMASALEGGYHEVWGRDSMITLLGAVSSADTDLLRASRASLDTLGKHQTELGLIPNNIDVENNEPQYRAYMDGTLWYILGAYAYFKATNDIKFIREHKETIDKALSWISHQDVDNFGLVSTQEAANWMDLFSVRGKTLYDNALYYAVLRAREAIAKILRNEKDVKIFAARAKLTRVSFHHIFWIYESQAKLTQRISELAKIEKKIKNIRYLEDELIRIMKTCSNLGWRPYFLAFYGFREYGEWFDSFGNMLAILFGIASKEQTKTILDFVGQVGVSEPHPIKAVYPPIYPGEVEWRDYFKIGNLNLPYQYHNGGIWPFIGGFHVLALVRARRMGEAKAALERLALANYKGKKYEWEFNEWLHGATGNPMGHEKQAWSAAMYICAYNSVRSKKVNLF